MTDLPPMIGTNIRQLPGINRKVEVTGAITAAGSIEITTNVLGDVQRWVLHTQERVVRESLIKLGWTPPETDGKQP